MIFENLKKLKNEEFYRYFGIKRFHFNEMGGWPLITGPFLI
ncbi:hypothetical protein [Spiroplasma endosymbiont of Villa modesta]